MKRLLTHGAALAAGICLAWGVAAWWHGGPAERDVHTERKAPPRRAAAPDRGASAGARHAGSGKVSTNDYRAAWDAIAHRSVTLEERQNLQRVVLERWARTDLRGAMLAALEDNRGASTYPVFMFGSGDSRHALRDAFARDPERVWAILQEPEFRFGREILVLRFSEALAADMPTLEIMLPRLPQPERIRVVEALMGRSLGGRAVPRADVMRLLSSLPDAMQARELVRMFAGTQGEPEPPETLLRRMTEATTPAERMVAEEEYLTAMKDGPRGSLMERWHALPPDARDRAVDAVVSSARSNGMLPEIIGMVRESGRLELLQHVSVTTALEGWARSWQTDDATAGLAWALSLPAGPEMDAVFSQTITGYAGPNLEELREWIGTVPPGWHRDRALAVYAATWKLEEEDRAWARKQIADPEVRKRLGGVER